MKKPLGPPNYHGPKGDTTDPATQELIKRLEEIRKGMGTCQNTPSK